MTGISLILVIPCFNEALRLDRDAFFDFLQPRLDTAVFLIDDGSCDETPRLLESWAQTHPRIRFIRRPRNGGKAEAVRHGVADACATLGPFRSEAFVGFWDADLSAPLAEVDDLRAALEMDPGCEAVFGARVKMAGRTIVRRATRHYVGRAFASVVSLFLNLPFYDTQCGAKLFRHGPALAAAFEGPFLTRWIFDVEVALRLRHWAAGGGRSLEEISVEYPLKVWKHRAGSKLRWTDGVRVLVDVLRLLGRYGRAERNV